MKKKLSLLVLLSSVLCSGFIGAQESVDLEQEFPSYAGTMPSSLQDTVNTIVEKHRPQLSLLLGADKRPYAQIREEMARAHELLEQLGAVVLKGNSQYVFALPEELRGHIFKVTKRPIAMAEAAEMIGAQGVLNSGDCQKLFGLLDTYNVDSEKPWVDPFRTHHILSMLLSAKRIREIKQNGECDLSNVVVPESYGVLLDPQQPAQDRNCFVVQKQCDSPSLLNILSDDKTQAEIHYLLEHKELLVQVYNLIRHAGIWNPRRLHLTKSGEINVTNPQKRDRYLPRIDMANEKEHHKKFFIRPEEQQHLMLCGLEELANMLQNHPELFAVILEKVKNDQAAQAALQTAPHISCRYEG